eukprot:TRINITY_DN40731_c0_g1_i1.p1 TRINITY_DN40731_c0_g1~~TRINITY_DN40731_c0_g1_i1.p1  ORF type:complete len:729 (-),score=104.83 TRINITY_DN40731_c0_g1_i1:453-2639(-)
MPSSGTRLASGQVLVSSAESASRRIRPMQVALFSAVLLADISHGPRLLARADEAPSKSSDILTTMAWCTGVQEGLDWRGVLTLAKTQCVENEDEDAVLRIRCHDGAMEAILDAARMLLEDSSHRTFACANGVAFVLAVTLAQRREALAPREVGRAMVLLWGALQENFLMDASIWPTKTVDVLELFHKFPPALDFPALPKSTQESGVGSLVTIVVPRCDAGMASKLKTKFPNMAVLAGVSHAADAQAFPSHWRTFEDVWQKPLGSALNGMLETVSTPLSLVVTGSILPTSMADIEKMVYVVTNRRVLAVGGPLVDADRIYSDFCYNLKARHYKLSFDAVYEKSVIFDADSAAAIRGSWFREEAIDGKKGPCKLCDTLPPTFLARTDALYAVRFHPALDGEWALLDFSLRTSRAPLVEVKKVAKSEPPLGWRHGKAAVALCPFVRTHEMADRPRSHLYGRRDTPENGLPAASAWFGEDGTALGVASGHGPGAESMLSPAQQFKLFLQANHLREFTGPEGITKHGGCTLHGGNCPVPDWVYRGWATPPCCKETMRHLLFYIAGLFDELNIRYIITDGVLLGSYKYGGMLDWDADVDLHIHNDDFGRLEGEVKPRVAADGHYLRKHVNNESFLLQANDQNYLLIELNKRKEHWDADRVWHLPVEGRLFPAMEDAHLNLSSWYGLSFFQHRLRHVPEWEEADNPMFCATPYHYNCVDRTQVPDGEDCRKSGIC